MTDSLLSLLWVWFIYDCCVIFLSFLSVLPSISVHLLNCCEVKTEDTRRSIRFEQPKMDDLIRCPYDSTHLMKKTKYHGHLVKCMKQHPELAICVFNASHRMSKKDMEAHIDICDSRHRLMSTKPWANQDNKPWTGGCMTVDTSREVKVVSNECWD